MFEKIPKLFKDTIVKSETPENPEIERLEKPVENILRRIMKHVESGEYNLIIGSDASGRVPTLVFRKFINYVHKRGGFQLPKTIFLAGAGMGLKDKPEPDFLKHKKEEALSYIERFNPKRVLIVEDTIVRGSSIYYMCEILKSLGVPFDVVSITSYSTESDLKETKSYLGADELYVGSESGTGIYGSRHLGGVIKEEEKTFSEPYKRGREQGEQENIQRKVNQVRKDVNIVADHIIDWYESRKR